MSSSHEAKLGMRHALLVFTAPASLFRRVEDTGAYGGALAALLLLVTLLGYLQYQTGLIDRLVDVETERELSQVEKAQTDLVDRLELKQKMEDARKQGEFKKILSKITVIGLNPVIMLGSLLLIASFLYAVVALLGRKPEYHTLMSICVYAAFIELVAMGLRLGMMVHYRSMDMDTSLRILGEGTSAAVLGAVDPFRIWFWILVTMGMVVTEQLSRRAAIITGTVMCLVSAGIHAAIGMSTRSA